MGHTTTGMSHEVFLKGGGIGAGDAEVCRVGARRSHSAVQLIVWSVLCWRALGRLGKPHTLGLNSARRAKSLLVFMMWLLLWVLLITLGSISNSKGRPESSRIYVRSYLTALLCASLYASLES